MKRVPVSAFPARAKSRLIRRFLPRIEKQLKEEYPEVISVTVGNRERGGEVIEDDVLIKVCVDKKLNYPANPIPRSIEVKTRAKEYVEESQRYGALVVELDVFSVSSSKFTGAATVRTNAERGCLAGRIRWSNGRRAWLTVSHLLQRPSKSAASHLRTIDGGVRLERAPGCLWLEDPRESGYPLDATAVVEVSDMGIYRSWYAAQMDAKIWTEDLAGLSNFRVIDQTGTVHRLIYVTTLPKGSISYAPGRFHPTAHLFSSNTHYPIPGDSGGPVWLEFNGTQYFVGVQSSNAEFDGGSGYFLVMPVHAIQRAFKYASFENSIRFSPLG